MDEPKTHNIDELLQQGIAAAKAAQRYESEQSAAADQAGSVPAAHNELKEKARRLLLLVTELDENNVQAWLWLSAVMDDLIDKYTCLENVIALEPDHQAAKAGLEMISQQITPSYARRDVVETTSVPQEQLQAVIRPPRLGRTTQLWVNSLSDDYEEDYSWYQQVEEGPGTQALLQPEHEPAMPVEAKCPFCHKTIRNMDMTCPHCELSLVMDCPKCITLMDVEQPVCSQCGYEMGDYRLGSVYFTQLATGYQRYSRLSKALAALQLAEKMEPDQPDLYRHMGAVQAEMGKTGAAIATLERALVQEPDQVGPYLALGKVYQQNGQWEKAEQIYRQAQKALPKSSGPHFALGDLFLQRGQPNKARGHLQRATRLNPNDGLAWMRLGQLYDGARKRRPAVRAYRKALKRLSPGLAEWKQVYGRLQVLDRKVARGWPELIRQLVGPVLIPVLAILLVSGLRPWTIDWPVWVGLSLAISGAFLAVSGISLPRNPVIRLLTGREGLKGLSVRVFVAIAGALFWLAAMGIILWPLRQSFVEWLF